MIGQLSARPFLNSWNKFDRMTHHVLRRFHIRLRLQVVPQPIEEGMRGLACAMDIGKFDSRQAAPASIIERRGRVIFHIFQIIYWAPQYFGEKFAIFVTIGVDVCEPCHRLGHDHVQFVVGYVTISPIEALVVWAVIYNVVWSLEPERIGHVLCHRELLHAHLILAPFRYSKSMTTFTFVVILFMSDVK